MITFNVQAHNSNYYIGHEPSNHSGNCWGDEDHALVLSIEQARALVEAWPGQMKIVISVKMSQMSPDAFERELFCARGGCWYVWPHRDRLIKQMACSHENVIYPDDQSPACCEDCGARHSGDRHWYDPTSGTMLNGELVL